MTAPATTATGAKAPALWEDFIDILTSPARVFERRRGSGFGAQLFIVAALAAIISAASLPLMGPMRERAMSAQMDAMRKRGMTDEQVASGRAIGEKFASVGAVVGAFVGIPIVAAIVALVVWGVASLFDAKMGYREAGLVTTYSLVPTILSMILGAVLLAVMDADSLPMIQQPTVAPVLLLGRDASPLLTALATRFGLGDIWSFFITGIGVSVLGRVPRAKGFIVAAILWVIGTGVGVAIALRTAAAMS